MPQVTRHRELFKLLLGDTRASKDAVRALAIKRWGPLQQLQKETDHFVSPDALRASGCSTV